MGVVNKIFTSVSEMYNSMNPLTLSGVNDVIVIKRKDGSFKCSPFQLRFSKLQFNHSKSQIVHLFINGQMTDVNMTITPQGDLYFEETVDINVSYMTKQQYDETLVAAIMENEFFDSTFKNDVLHRELPSPEIKNKLLENFPKTRPSYPPAVYKERRFTKSSSSLNLAESPQLYQNKKIEETLNQNYILRNKMSNDDILQWKRARHENVQMRIYSKNLLFKNNFESYYDLSVMYEKFNYMLASTEHCEFLINKNVELLNVIEDIYNNESQSYFEFSECLYARIENGKPHETFQKYLVKRLEDADSIVVYLKNKRFKFYLSFVQFTKIFFEVKIHKNKKKHLLKLLEESHNESLGWNLFGTKKPVKRDIQFSLVLNSNELKGLNLNKGRNEAIFKISGADEQLEAAIFLWDETDKIVISDIDGTITKSDVWGLISGYIGTDWTHTGVAPLFSKISENGYKIVYLSARSLGQSYITKEYLNGIEQDSFRLPEGPLLLNPDGVMGALVREIITKNPDEFKIDVLKGIKELFGGEFSRNVLVAGFGNKLTDVIAYNAVEIPKNRIYTINPHGQIQSEYSKSLVGTYSTLNDFIDTIFPEIKSEANYLVNKFNEFNYWM